jgi:transposase
VAPVSSITGGVPTAADPPAPAEFRQRAVALARTGDTPIAQLAKKLQISESCLWNWMAHADADDNGSANRLTSTEKKELAELRRRNRQLEMEDWAPLSGKLGASDVLPVLSVVVRSGAAKPHAGRGVDWSRSSVRRCPWCCRGWS